MNMNSSNFKPLLVRDKEFLNELYASQSVPEAKRLIMFASDQKLDTLIKYFHFLANGEIKIKKEHFDLIKKSQLISLKRKVEKKKALAETLKGERKTKVSFLQKLANVLPNLLYPLFNET